MDSAFERLFELRGYGDDDGGGGRGRGVVVGRLMDQNSMEGLYRLSTLPINKKFQGIIGAKEGPPLVNVRVVGVKVQEGRVLGEGV